MRSKIVAVAAGSLLVAGTVGVILAHISSIDTFSQAPNPVVQGGQVTVSMVVHNPDGGGGNRGTQVTSVTGTGLTFVSSACVPVPAGGSATVSAVLQTSGTTPVGSYNITLHVVMHTNGGCGGTTHAQRDQLVPLTVSAPLSQTITFDPLPDVTYGVAPITLTATASSGLAVSYSASGSCSVVGSTLTVSAVGGCSVTASQAGDATYAAATPVTRTFNIGAATLTVTADDKSRAYGASNPPLTATITGFVNGDTLAVVSGSASLATSATPASPAGTYPITASAGTLSAANYTFAFVGGTLTVGPASQTITFGALPDVTYGVVPITLTATASSGLAVAYGTVGPCSASGSTLTITGAGTCDVTATQPGNANWDAAAPVTQSFTIDPAILTVTADDKSRAYGASNPPLTATITGFVNGDSQAVVSGVPLLVTTATPASAVGPYPITASVGSLMAANYTFSFVDGTLTVTSGSQTISFGVLGNVTYGVAPIALTATASSGLPVSYATSGPCSESGGSLTITGVGTCDVTASQPGDANWDAAAPVTRSFTIDPATLTVTADDKSRGFGVANPPLTATITGFVNGETLAVVSGSPVLSTTAVPLSPVGPYPISVSLGTLAAANYTFALVDGTLTVTTGNQTITFGVLADRTYGDPSITLGATASSGLPVGYETTGPCSETGGILTLTGVGTCSVTASQPGSEDWSAATPVTRTFDINPATLTVTANDASKVQGDPNPPLTATITGYVNGENGSVLTSLPVCTTTALVGSPVGTYPITCPGAAADNYTVTNVPGTLTVTPGAIHHIVITPGTATITAGGSLAYTAEAFDASDNSLGDVTADTTFSIGGGSCTGATCGSTVAGTHTVTGNCGGLIDTAQLDVVADAPDHVVVSPDGNTILVGASQPFTVNLFDRFGNPLGDVTGMTTFSIDGGGSCTGTSCGAAATGDYTVTATTVVPDVGTFVDTAVLHVSATRPTDPPNPTPPPTGLEKPTREAQAPIPALLIAFAMSLLGLWAVDRRRRSIR